MWFWHHSVNREEAQSFEMRFLLDFTGWESSVMSAIKDAFLSFM